MWREFLCFYAWDSCGQRHVFSGFPYMMSHSCKHNISGKPWWKFFQMCPKHLIELKNEMFRFWWSAIKVSLTSCQPHSCKQYISGPPWGNFFKYGTNVHLDTKINWLDIDDQMLKSLLPHILPIYVNTISQECLEGSSLHMAQMSIWTYKLIRTWLERHACKVQLEWLVEAYNPSLKLFPSLTSPFKSL